MGMTTDPAPVVDMVPVADLLQQARAVPAIADAAQAQAVADLLAAALDLKATIARTFDEHIARAYEAHRALCAEKRKAQAPAFEAETVLRGLLTVWATAEQERERREQAERDAADTTRAVALEAEAAAAEAVGDYSAAEAARVALASAPLPALVQPRAPLAGVSVRETWSARVDDLGALVRAAAHHAPWLALVLPNQQALDQQAKSLRQRLAIPGVTAVRSTGIASRRRP